MGPQGLSCSCPTSRAPSSRQVSHILRPCLPSEEHQAPRHARWSAKQKPCPVQGILSFRGE